MISGKGERERWTSPDFVLTGNPKKSDKLIIPVLTRFVEVLQVVTKQNKLDVHCVGAGLDQIRPGGVLFPVMVLR